MIIIITNNVTVDSTEFRLLHNYGTSNSSNTFGEAVEFAIERSGVKYLFIYF